MLLCNLDISRFGLRNLETDYDSQKDCRISGSTLQNGFDISAKWFNLTQRQRQRQKQRERQRQKQIQTESDSGLGFALFLSLFDYKNSTYAKVRGLSVEPLPSI